MWGIIQKDFYDSFCVPKNLVNTVFGLGLCWLLVWLLGADEYMLMLMVTMAIPMTSVSVLEFAIEQDELVGFDDILLTYPISKKKIVLARFIDSFLFTAGCSVFTAAMLLWYGVGNRAMDIKTAVLLWLASIVASLFMLSISSLVFFWLGNKKGTIVYLVMVIVTAFTYVLAYWNVPVEKIVALGPWKLLGIGCVISLLAVTASYWGCLEIYTRRHS